MKTSISKMGLALFIFALQGCVSTQTSQTDTSKIEKSAMPAVEQARLLIDKGKIKLKRNKYKSALQAFEKAMKLDPNNKEIYGLAANASKKSRKYDQAIKYYNAVLAIQPNDFNAYGNIGYISHKLKRYDDAIAAFKAVERINPNEYRALDDLADVYFELKDYSNCLVYLDKFESAISTLDVNLISEKTKQKLEKVRKQHVMYKATIASSTTSNAT